MNCTPLILIILMLVAFATALCAQTEKIELVWKINTFADGTTSSRLMAISRTHGKAPLLSSTNSFTSSRGWHWPPTVKSIDFSVIEDASKYRKKLYNIANIYINKLRGNSNVPRINVLSHFVNILPESAFASRGEYLNQFKSDGSNTIIMTDNDDLLNHISGSTNKDIMSTVWLRGSAEIEYWSGDEYYGSFSLSETDIYISSDFFKRKNFQYQIDGAATFSLALGYKPTCWSHDILSQSRHHVDKQQFKNKRSELWNKFSYARDKLFYESGSASEGSSLPSPAMLPLENEVIDIAGYLSTEGTVSRSSTLEFSPILVLSNLKSFGKGKHASVKISRYDNSAPSGKVDIVQLSEISCDYPMLMDEGLKLFSDYRVNEIRLTQPDTIAKLKAAIRKYGKKRKIDGLKFKKALRIRIEISGYLSTDGQRLAISRNYWLINSEE